MNRRMTLILATSVVVAGGSRVAAAAPTKPGPPAPKKAAAAKSLLDRASANMTPAEKKSLKARLDRVPADHRQTMLEHMSRMPLAERRKMLQHLQQGHGAGAHGSGGHRGSTKHPAKQHRHGQGSKRSEGVPIGAKVPEFSVKDAGGRTWTLAELRKAAQSGVVSLTFWCSFCHSCRNMEARLDRLAAAQKGKVAVAALDASAGETAERVRDFAKTKGLTLPILLDSGGTTADIFGVGVTTTTVIIDREGVLRYRGQFAADHHAFAEDALNAVLAGKPVAQVETPQRG